jgi:hypothetical protein
LIGGGAGRIGKGAEGIFREGKILRIEAWICSCRGKWQAGSPCDAFFCEEVKQELPGAIAEGDTEQEGLDNIIEVLEEVLRFEKEKPAQTLAV